jgi:hypothetical protein
VLTLFTGIVTVSRSIIGLVKKKKYTRLDFGFSLSFSIALYLQLLLGFIIYVMLRASIDNPAFEIPSSSNDASLRFWAIEHIALMIFALFLTQLGRIYIKKSIKPLKRFKASVFYYGSALVLILFSLSIALFFK